MAMVGSPMISCIASTSAATATSRRVRLRIAFRAQCSASGIQESEKSSGNFVASDRYGPQSTNTAAPKVAATARAPRARRSANIPQAAMTK